MLADKTYRSLKTMIYRRELEPGQRLIERKLSRKLGVSRVPLRESLMRLEREGLVKRVPHGPAQVLDFTNRDVVEMYSLRLLLEPYATGLAAVYHKRLLIRELKELCKLMTRAAKAGNWAELDQRDSEFHHAIVKASGHRTLFQAYTACHIQICGLLRDFKHAAAGKPPETIARDHLPLIAAIEKRDMRLAEATAFEHVRVTVDKIQERFSTPISAKQKPIFDVPNWPKPPSN